MEEAKRVVDRIKLSGAFDSYRQEIFSQMAESSQMKSCMESYSALADETIRSALADEATRRAPEKADIRKLRERLKREINSRRNLTNDLFQVSDTLLSHLTQSPQFNGLVNRMVREELGMASPDTQPSRQQSESASDDMEVSSGATTRSASSSPSAAAPSPYSPDNSPLAMSVSHSSPSTLHQSAPSTPTQCNGTSPVAMGEAAKLNDGNHSIIDGHADIDHAALSPVSSDSPSDITGEGN